MNTILLLLILLILLILAMLCRSLVHTLLHHYSRFHGKFDVAEDWWNPDISWKNKYAIKWTIKILKWTVVKFKIPVQVSDGFHFFNTIELGCYDGMLSLLLTNYFLLPWWMGFVIFGVIGLLLMPQFFNLGYNKLWI